VGSLGMKLLAPLPLVPTRNLPGDPGEIQSGLFTRPLIGRSDGRCAQRAGTEPARAVDSVPTRNSWFKYLIQALGYPRDRVHSRSSLTFSMA
jgi:hypothetical protein